MKRLIFILPLTLLFTACVPSNQYGHKKYNTQSYKSPSKAKLKAFHKAMNKVALSTKNDKHYRKIKLDNREKKIWLKNLMYRLWNRQITRKQFIDIGVNRFHNHAYEFNFIANGFQKYS